MGRRELGHPPACPVQAAEDLVRFYSLSLTATPRALAPHPPLSQLGSQVSDGSQLGRLPRSRRENQRSTPGRLEPEQAPPHFSAFSGSLSISRDQELLGAGAALVQRTV